MTARVYAFAAGAVALFIGVFFLSGELRLRLGGVTAEATIEMRGSRCSLEWTLADGVKRYQTVECGEAQAFLQKAGITEAKSSSIDYVRFSYADASRERHSSELGASALPADMPVGAHFPVVYNPKRPDVAELPLTLTMAAMLMLMPAIGIFGILFGFGGFGAARAAAPRMAMARR
jgi:hypothetical protein